MNLHSRLLLFLLLLDRLTALLRQNDRIRFLQEEQREDEAGSGDTTSHESSVHCWG